MNGAGTVTDQFTRREVNRALLGEIEQVRPPRRAAIAPGAIAGGWHHGLKNVCGEIAVGERLRLRAERENPHDANAVAVHRADGLMLGYVSREANEPIARPLASGARVEAQVVGRLVFRRSADVPDDFAFTGFTSGDPRIRLILGG